MVANHGSNIFSYILVIQNTEYNQEKKEAVTNITIHKIIEIIESHTVLEVTNDRGEIHLLINLKYTVMVADDGSPILTTPYSTRLVFCETNIRGYQYKTKADTDYYL